MTKPFAAVLICLALALGGGPALAGAPQPKRAFDQQRMGGRWYEIAHFPRKQNRDCQGTASDWTPVGPDRFRITAICRKGALDGPVSTLKGWVKVTDRATNAKVRMSMLGGLVASDYWLLDRADDYSWLILGTPGGGFISIMSTRPKLPASMRGEAVSRARALGYDTSRFIWPAH